MPQEGNGTGKHAGQSGNDLLRVRTDSPQGFDHFVLQTGVIGFQRLDERRDASDRSRPNLTQLLSGLGSFFDLATFQQFRQDDNFLILSEYG